MPLSYKGVYITVYHKVYGFGSMVVESLINYVTI